MRGIIFVLHILLSFLVAHGFSQTWSVPLVFLCWYCKTRVQPYPGARLLLLVPSPIEVPTLACIRALSLPLHPFTPILSPSLGLSLSLSPSLYRDVTPIIPVGSASLTLTLYSPSPLFLLCATSLFTTLGSLSSAFPSPTLRFSLDTTAPTG